MNAAKDQAGVPRGGDHRRSYGLDFIDIRKEIVSELKNLEGRLKQTSSLKSNKQDVTHDTD